MSAPKELVDLVERFERNRDAYRSGRYNETQLRREFVDPLFELLGWDVNNRQGFAEQYKDVVHEDRIAIGFYPKAPDYAFRVGGVRKFFVETKSPSKNLKDDPEPAFQLRRYAWSAKLPLSILTDFDELAVYDCRVKPAKGDKASIARILYLTSAEYLGKWDDLAAIFARQAVLKGSFDAFAESKKKKRGTAEVDEAFLAQIEQWRELLAKNLALRNQDLGVRELNFAVQRIIDRIVFLRICEDRGIEQHGQLQALLNAGRVYARLGELFHRADHRYNSGLFHFRREKGRHEPPDELTLGLDVDDKALKDIIGELYYPESPYEFSVLPADILGQVYERFLGKVIRLTAGHQAKVEEKPEVRKAGGVYYTPTYVVEYIVEQTAGKLLDEAKTVKIAAELKILDPACGSGSFLIGAYQRLLYWHRDWYAKNGAERHAKGRDPKLYQGPGGEWRLTTGEKKRILTNNIFGVDIDPQAVEVTKLSLLLKVLEGESGETLASQLKLFHERALPDLGSNIKCGNSLIGPDFYEDRQMDLLDEEERYRVNAFDWRLEFPDTFARQNPGFDAVIGNPPYLRMEEFKEIKAYLRSRYRCHDERSDLYAYFMEKAHQLLRSRGRFGMIVSNKFLRANYGRPLRELLSREAWIESVVDFAGLPVFVDATVRPIVIVTSRNGGRRQQTNYTPPAPFSQFAAVRSRRQAVKDVVAASSYSVQLLRSTSLAGDAWAFTTADVFRLLTAVSGRSVTLSAYCNGEICMGVKSGLMKAFVVDERTRRQLVRANREAADILKPFLTGRDIRRYELNYRGLYLIYTYHGVDIAKYHAVREHLSAFKSELEKRVTKQEWYELQQPQYNFANWLGSPKIVFPDIATAPRFAMDDAGCFGANTMYFIPRRDAYLCGLLNSHFGFLYFRTVCAGLESKNENYLRFFGQYLENFPVPAETTRRGSHKRQIGELAERMGELKSKLRSVRTSHDRSVLERQIGTTDRQIDQLVYELYGLTDEEIRVVEEATAR